MNNLKATGTLSFFAGIGLAIVVLLFITNCAVLKSAFKAEPQKVEMVVLTELMYQGGLAGIEAPAEFGDFSITHYMGNVVQAGDNTAIVEYYPIKDNPMYFLLVVKWTCPEPVALSTYNADTEEDTYWIYDAEGQAWKVDEETYDYFLKLDHPCVADMPEGIDATLTI